MMKTQLENRIKSFIFWQSEEIPQKKVFFRSFRISLKKLFIMWRPNVAIRYSPVLEFVKNYKFKDPSILEIGSGSIGITRYLNKPVTGVDLSFSGPRSSLLKTIAASATSLPFEDNQFDIAISMDVLEHLPKKDREVVISEMIRVSKGTIIVGVPCGDLAEKWEAKARKLCMRKRNKMNGKSRDNFVKRSNFLKEHISNKLPSVEEMISYLGVANSGKQVKIIGNEAVWIWYILTLGSVRLNTFLWLMTVSLGYPLIPLIKRFGWGGHYRKIFIFNKAEETINRAKKGVKIST